MRKYILVFILLTFVCYSQNKQSTFPEDFYGKYKGKLNIVNPNGKMEIDMEFHLFPTDSSGKYQYTIIYASENINQERKYLLIEKDKSKGYYIIDENNGIFLDAKLLNNTLYSVFEVQGNILTTTEKFYEDYLDFEIIFMNKEKVNKSGNTDSETPEVISYPISVIQFAKLEKYE